MQAEQRSLHSSLFRAVVVELDALILSSSQGYPTRDQDKTIPLTRGSVSALPYHFENQLTSSLDIDSLEARRKEKRIILKQESMSFIQRSTPPAPPSALQFSCIDLEIAGRRFLLR